MASISYVLAAGQHVERLVLLGGAAATLGLTGNELANVLVGNEANNALNGGGGNDVLEGNGGQDAMAGGAGDDDYYVENAGDSVAELAGEGDDAVYASVTYALAAGQSVELLAATSAGATTAIDLTGNDLANSLTGTMGANRLNGGAGADAMTGLGGNDSYIVDHAGDTAAEAPGGGTDIVYSAVSYSLNDGSEVESLSTITWEATDAINLTGNGLANTLTGNAGVNQLNGKAGADTMTGRERQGHLFHRQCRRQADRDCRRRHRRRRLHLGQLHARRQYRRRGAGDDQLRGDQCDQPDRQRPRQQYDRQ